MKRDELELEPLASPQETASRSTEPPAKPRAPRMPTLLLVALLLLAAGEAVALVLQHISAATEADWSAAAKAMRGERKREEPRLFAPLWAEPAGSIPSIVTTVSITRQDRTMSLFIRSPKQAVLREWFSGYIILFRSSNPFHMIIIIYLISSGVELSVRISAAFEVDCCDVIFRYEYFARCKFYKCMYLNFFISLKL